VLDLYEALLQRRDGERKAKKAARQVIRGDELPQEVSRQGLLHWYLHPDIHDTVLRTMLFFVQIIPPGSRSGKMRHQGGVAHLILEGRGYSIVNGARHDWEAINSLFLPILREGVVVQHFNADPDQPVRMAVAMPNFVDALGVDLGAGWEQLEDAPEYAQKNGARS
jgi:gentisate 1,2-dioxygenase